MPDNYFERILKQKLLSLIHPMNQGDWDILENKLPALFDEKVREKLETASIAYKSHDWQEFSALLDVQPFDNALREKLAVESSEVPAEDWGLMEASLFDAQVRNKVESHSYDDSDWQEMETALQDQKLAAKLEAYSEPLVATAWGDFEDFRFDQQVQSQLEGLETQYQKQDWDRMLALLEGQTSRPFAWWLGVAAALLVGLGGIAFLSQNIFEYNQKHYTKKENKALLPKTPLKQTENVFSEESHSLTQNQVEVGGQNNRKSQGKLIRKAKESNTDLLTKVLKTSDSSVQMEILTVKKQEVIQLQAKSLRKNLIQRPRLIFKMSKFPIAFLAEPNSNPSATLQAEQRIPFKKTLALGTYMAGQGSIISTDDSPQIGGSAGMRVEWGFAKKWKLVSGLAYSKRNIEHGYYEYDTYTQAQIKGENLLLGTISAIELPISVRRTLAQDQKVSLYAQAGITPMVTLKEKYSHFDRQSEENVGLSAARPIQSLDAEKQSLYLKPYLGYAQMAAGISYELASNLHLQFEPYLNLGLSPVSEEKKHLHSFGLGVGLMYQLGK